MRKDEIKLHSFLIKAFNIKAEAIEKLSGDASTRKYWRIKLSEKFKSKYPSTIILALIENNNDETIYSFCNISKFLSMLGINVPKIYCVYKNKLSALLLEDCGNLTLLEYLKGKNNKIVFETYTKVIDLLIKLQVEKNNKYCKYIAFKRAFDIEKYMWEFEELFQKYFINKFCSSKITKKINDELKKYYLKISSTLNEYKNIFVHRDFQSKNLMIKNDKYILLDYQDARLGILHYDLVSLLYDSYFIMEDNLRNKLIDYYISNTDKWKSNQMEFMKLIDYTIIQRKMHDIGIFVRLKEEFGKENYIKFIPTSMNYIISVLNRNKEFSQLKAILSDIGVFDITRGMIIQ